MAKDGSACHVEGSEYHLIVGDGCHLRDPVVVVNGRLLAPGREFRMVRSEPWRRNPEYVVEFLSPVKVGDVIQFGGDGSRITFTTPVDLSDV